MHRILTTQLQMPHRLAAACLRLRLRSAVALLLVLCSAFEGLTALGSTLRVRYPQQEADGAYPVKVLSLALSKSGMPYTMEAMPYQMPQGRALKQLAQGIDLNVVWSITSKEREQDLLPVRIPIDKGLYGWRIFLVNKQDVPKFSGIKSLNDLKALKAGQGHDWPDTTILRANGLPVEVSPRYDSLFRMLQSNRFDYFPRSVLEIWGEAGKYANTGLVVEPRVLLHYPTAFYFFVSKNNPELATVLERGLNAAIKDGSFERLFQQTYGSVMQRANLSGRTGLQLNNPLLPANMPLQRKELWIQ
jgi:ABC-type amino acid transport substrate-binding protein